MRRLFVLCICLMSSSLFCMSEQERKERDSTAIERALTEQKEIQRKRYRLLDQLEKKEFGWRNHLAIPGICYFCEQAYGGSYITHLKSHGIRNFHEMVNKFNLFCGQTLCNRADERVIRKKNEPGFSVSE